jgi:mannosyltransferase OCH1-like enzyme
MEIPKIIHYCWFGPKPIPKLELKCMESWGKYFPDYELMFWNEKTFDIKSNIFAKQAYENKKYAFVSDCVRANVLNNYGGIYLDTDVEILSNFSHLLKGKNAVLGFETSKFVGTAFMAFVPNQSIIKAFSDYYVDRSFLSENGDIEITANPAILASILKKNNLVLNGKEQLINGIHVFKRELFFPKKIADNKFRITEETLAIHYFEGSWLTESQKKRGTNIIWIEVCRPILRKCKSLIFFIIGEKKAKKFEIKVRNSSWLS